MGNAFESTDGDLAEKLFAALKAGDAAGGDSRGRQSASMLVVRKGGGRNTNNDRYIYINADDKNMEKARAAAQQAVVYAPGNSNNHMQLAFFDYALGDKSASLEEFSKARDLRPDGFA